MNIEQRLCALETRLNGAETALTHLGMRTVYYPEQHHSSEWVSTKTWWLLEVPHPIEGTVWIKAKWVVRYIKELFEYEEEWPNEVDVEAMVRQIGINAFRAWQRSKSECGPEGNASLRKFLGIVITQRGDRGGPGPINKWATHTTNEIEALPTTTPQDCILTCDSSDCHTHS